MKTLICMLLVVFIAIHVSAIRPAPEQDNGKASAYLVFIDTAEEPATFAIKVLTSVFASQEAARGAIVYIYKFNAFAAKLTPEQASQLSKEPGVLNVSPSKGYHLHPPSTGKIVRPDFLQ